MTAQNRPGWSIGPQVVFGLAVVVFGLLLTASNLGVRGTSGVFRFWPLLFTTLGIAILFEKGCSGGRKLFGAALVIGGLWQTANSAFGLGIYVDDYWPLILVGLGIFLVMRSFGAKAPAEDYTNVGTPVGGSMSSPGAAGPGMNFAGGDETVNAFAFMGGVRRNIVSPAFRRGNLTAIMGGVLLDMRQSQASGGETVVEVFAIWGGIDLKVPPDWQVVNEITPIMGGVEDRSTHTSPIRHRLVLKGVVLMAGVEVKS